MKSRQVLIARTCVLLIWLAAASSSGQTYTILHTFTGGVDGGYPGFAQLALSGTTLYGTTSGGGSNGNGTVFKVNTDGSDFTVLKNFTGSDGSGPEGGVVISGTTLYGATSSGGSRNCGTIFKLSTDGSGYSVLKNFNGTDGDSPFGRVLLSGSTLYGTTYKGGDFGYGTVFKLGADGNGYTLLKSFDRVSNSGYKPMGGLVLSDGTLYGMTSDGPEHFGGTVFKVNTDGSEFMLLKSFPSSSGAVGIDGLWPWSALTVSGSTLYGTADWGGAYGNGTVFRLNTDGTGFVVLKHFTGGGDGAGVEAGLLLSGATLYGTTYEGGDYPHTPPYYGHGTVFSIRTDGGGFTVLKQFTGSDGGSPRAGLILSDTTLFGMTGYGGSAGCGVIFSLSVAPPTIITPPQSQTAEIGSTVDFTPGVTADPAVTYLFYFNDTNLLRWGTNCDLRLTNVDLSRCGTYTIVVTNIFGTVTSGPVMLNVIAPVERRPVPAVSLFGQAGDVLGLDYRDSLSPSTNWETMATMTLSNPPQLYFDLTEPLPPQRFFRSWQMVLLGTEPMLDLHMVPAITLTGNVGDNLRLDYINAIGPTDAWVTLDTVTLTNTSQLYFDVSSIGQPRRLYRITPVP